LLKINSFIVWKYLANGRTGGETGPFAEAQYEHGMTQRFQRPREERLHNVRFSNRPFGVKHFQTVHRCSVDVTHGLARASLRNRHQGPRLCIARTLAIQSEVILLDEPCSAIDPISSAKIEQTIHELKRDHTIVIVTHNLQQAARISDFAGFMLLGELIEFDATRGLFAPRDPRTHHFVTGRFG